MGHQNLRIHQLPIEEHRRWRAILHGGISVGNAITGGSGTLGTSVFDAVTSEQLILSNWHVLCGRPACGIGESIIQPGTGGGDTGTAADVVATLVRSSLTSVVDAAVAAVRGNRMVAEEILEVGRPKGAATAVLGESARKSGRTTGLSVGQVADVDADFDVDYTDVGMGIRHVEHQVVIEGDAVSNRGDSGSVWLNGRDEIIALNFAGNDAGDRADANPIANVIDDLGILVNRGVPLHEHAAVAMGTG